MPWIARGLALLLLVVPTLAILAGAELLIRWTGAGEKCPSTVHPPNWVCDPVLHFKFNPKLVIRGRRLNGLGFRGSEFTGKEPGVFRILSLGDSCTFGVVPDDEGYFVAAPYPRRLEQLLASRGGAPPVEVLNAGSPGYNSYQGLQLLRTRLRGLEPDLITVRFGWNDHLMSREGRIEGAFRESHNPIVREVRELLLRTALYPFAARVRLELRDRFEREGDRQPVLPAEWKPNLSIEDYKYAVRRIAELGRARGAHVWLLASPQAFSSDDAVARYEALPRDAQARRILTYSAVSTFGHMREIHDRYADATREVAAELGIPLVDMDRIYRQARDAALFSLSDGLHPTQRGHDLEARVLYQRLLDSGILLASPRG